MQALFHKPLESRSAQGRKARKPITRGLIAGLLCTAGLLGGCSVNPVTGASELSLVSAEREVSIGQQQYLPTQQSQGGRYVVDPDLTVYVNEVGQKLARVSDRKGLPYEFVVLNNGGANAWALPGGKIAINRGLLLMLQDEAQLAAVLGHEIVHSAARHGASQMSKGMLAQAGIQLIDIASKDSGYGQLATTGANLGAGALLARYGREHELESDHYGMLYMQRAGYEPTAAVELQQLFVKLSQGRQADIISALFASHPPSQARVDANRSHAAQLKSRANNTGKRNRATYQKAIAQLQRDRAAYESYDKALASVAEQPKRALALVNKAIKQQPKEALFWQLKGKLQRQQGNKESALKSLDRAIGLNPELYHGQLERGLSHKDKGQNSQAQRDLLKSQDLLPTSLASYHLGELLLAEGKIRQALSYFQPVAKAGGELGKAAQPPLAQIQRNQSQQQAL